jgi:PKD repeat protein
VVAIDGQYTDGTGHAAYSATVGTEATDATAYPLSGCTVPASGDKGPPYTTCLTDAQLQTRLLAYINAEKLPKGPAQQYFVLLPHKVVTCLEPGVCSNNVFCAYHSSLGSAPNEIIYSDIPFSLLDSIWVKGCQDDGNAALQAPNEDTAGTNASTRYGDVALKYTSHEYVESATDPFGTGYWDAQGLENGDKCNGVSATEAKDGVGYDKNAFLPVLGGSAGSGTLFDQLINTDHYYIQSEWDNALGACLMKPAPLTGLSFSASPESATEGVATSFKAVVDDPYGKPAFTWKWGDGTESVGQAPSHAYAAPGSYEVTLSAKDELTNSTTAPATRPIVVADELPTASFIAPSAAQEKIAVKFEGAGNDPDGSIVSYAWSFGDGTESGGATPEHTYTLGGTYTVTLTVTDSAGRSGAIAHPVMVSGAPATVTGVASPLAPTSATLNATVNPNGAGVSACSFEYGPSAAYGSLATCTPAPGGGNSAVAVSAPLTSLTPSASYHFRIVAGNSFGTRTGEDQVFTAPPMPQAAPAQAAFTAPFVAAPVPNSSFTLGAASVNRTTGVITFSVTVADPGRLSWLLTFQNGKFGVFAASTAKCRTGLVRLGGRCRPSRIVFAKGSRVVPAAGRVILKLKPSTSAVKALRTALRRNTGLPVAAKLTFLSARGGTPVSRTQTLTVRLKRR